MKGVLKSSVYAQCLLQTDRHTSEAKGTRIELAIGDRLRLQCYVHVYIPMQDQPLLRLLRGYNKVDHTLHCKDCLHHPGSSE